MNITAGVTISRNSSDEIHISFRDNLSGITFVNVNMTLSDFALALTGLAEVKAPAEVAGLCNVGKVRVTEPRSVVYSGNHEFDRKKRESWLVENCQEDGWRLNSCLGSQGSTTYQNGVTTLNYSVTKFVDPTDEVTA